MWWLNLNTSLERYSGASKQQGRMAKFIFFAKGVCR
jgi:hypothetical protein